MFSERGIQIIYKNYVPTQYSQIYGKFIPELSICDMLFNVGMKRTREILNRKHNRFALINNLTILLFHILIRFL